MYDDNRVTKKYRRRKIAMKQKYTIIFIVVMLTVYIKVDNTLLLSYLLDLFDVNSYGNIGADGKTAGGLLIGKSSVKE